MRARSSRAFLDHIDPIPFLDRRVRPALKPPQVDAGHRPRRVRRRGARSETRRDGRICAKSFATDLGRIPDTAFVHRLDLVTNSLRRNGSTRSRKALGMNDPRKPRDPDLLDLLDRFPRESFGGQAWRVSESGKRSAAAKFRQRALERRQFRRPVCGSSAGRRPFRDIRAAREPTCLSFAGALACPSSGDPDQAELCGSPTCRPLVLWGSTPPPTASAATIDRRRSPRPPTFWGSTACWCRAPVGPHRISSCSWTGSIPADIVVEETEPSAVDWAVWRRNRTL